MKKNNGFSFLEILLASLVLVLVYFGVTQVSRLPKQVLRNSALDSDLEKFLSEIKNNFQNLQKCTANISESFISNGNLFFVKKENRRFENIKIASFKIHSQSHATTTKAVPSEKSFSPFVVEVIFEIQKVPQYTSSLDVNSVFLRKKFFVFHVPETRFKRRISCPEELLLSYNSEILGLKSRSTRSL